MWSSEVILFFSKTHTAKMKICTFPTTRTKRSDVLLDVLLLEQTPQTPTAAAAGEGDCVLMNVSSEALTADYSILTIKLVDAVKKGSLHNYCWCSDYKLQDYLKLLLLNSMKNKCCINSEEGLAVLKGFWAEAFDDVCIWWVSQLFFSIRGQTTPLFHSQLQQWNFVV